MKKFIAILTLFLCFWAVPQVFAATATFDDLALAPGYYWNGDDDGTGTYSGFTSGDNYFLNYQYTAWNYWEGFASSNMTDTTTAGYTNQFSAITGGGVNNSSNYAVAYTANYNGQPAQTYNGYTTGEYAQVVEGFYVTNTTYAYLAMLNGEGGATAFGNDDWFLLTVYALDSSYSRQIDNYVEFYLAEGTDILSTWEWVDLSSLGAVYGLEFELTSSDNGQYGMNTPAYFAMDNLSSVPIPGAVLLLGSGLLGLAGLKRRRA